MIDKYKEQLLKHASSLDAIAHYGGKLINCATAVAEYENKKAVKALCKMLSDILVQNKQDGHTVDVARALNESLLKLYGYRSLREIYRTEESTNPEDEKSLDELLAELDQLVGLHRVKEKVKDLIAYQKVQLMRRSVSLKSPKSTLHLAFTGNPGTGKTTVARIVGRIYKQIGLLSRGQFIEVSRTDLIAGFQGQTAQKVKDVIEKAKGGVLFIDEAYSITENDHSDSYGRECLTELTKGLEDYRDDLVVIVAGYTEPMKKFFESNLGLKSRFNTFLEFDDYSPVELLDILKEMSNKEMYILSEGAEKKLSLIFDAQKDKDENQFANGRYVRNIFEEMIMNHARRIVNIANPTKFQLQELIDDDIPQKYRISTNISGNN